MKQKTLRAYSICTHSGVQKVTMKEAAHLLKQAKAHGYATKLIYTHYWDRPYGSSSASYFISKRSKKHGLSCFMLVREAHNFPIW